MRIAYLSCVFPPYPGGIGSIAQGLAKEMTRRGHEVHVFTPAPRHPEQAKRSEGSRTLQEQRDSSPPQADQNDRRVIIHFLRPWFRFGNSALLPQVLWRLRNFDVVHVLYPFFGTAEWIPLLRLVTRTKIVVHQTMEPQEEGWLGKVFALHSMYLMPMIFRSADTIVTVSEDYFQSSELTSVYQEFDKAPPIAFVPNGVDTEVFCPPVSRHPESASRADEGSRTNVRSAHADEILRSAQNDNLPVPVILFVGGLDRAHYFKGVHILLEALRILQWGGVAFRAVIAGDGSMRKEYEAHARENGLLPRTSEPSGWKANERVTLAPGSVEFVGSRPHPDLVPLYRASDVVVVPATAPVENFSIVAAEAQACGVPVIVSDFPGVRITIENGVTGYTVVPGDPEDLARKIFTLFEDPKRARAMGEAGRKRVSMFDWKVVGEKMEEVYEQVIT